MLTPEQLKGKIRNIAKEIAFEDIVKTLHEIGILMDSTI